MTGMKVESETSSRVSFGSEVAFNFKTTPCKHSLQDHDMSFLATSDICTFDSKQPSRGRLT